jgi:hypothetical protein
MMILSGEPPLSTVSGGAGALPATEPSFKRAFLGFLGSTSLLSTAMVLLSSL